jgi:chaperonin cofactor prefoldin
MKKDNLLDNHDEIVAVLWNNKTIIDEDADVYTKEGKLLIRFRKNKLNKAREG